MFLYYPRVYVTMSIIRSRVGVGIFEKLTELMKDMMMVPTPHIINNWGWTGRPVAYEERLQWNTDRQPGGMSSDRRNFRYDGRWKGYMASRWYVEQ